jgi:hypothetical protein
MADAFILWVVSQQAFFSVCDTMRMHCSHIQIIILFLAFNRLQVTPETKERYMPAASPEAHAAAIWGMALNRNVFRGPEELQQHPQQLQALQEAFTAAVVADVVASGRWDAEHQRVCSRYTVLHVLAAV